MSKIYDQQEFPTVLKQLSQLLQ
jgi:hypothetical protein